MMKSQVSAQLCPFRKISSLLKPITAHRDSNLKEKNSFHVIIGMLQEAQ